MPSPFHISQVSNFELAELGAQIRRIGENERRTRDEIATATADLLADAFEDANHVPELALTRVYRTCSAAQLHPQTRHLAGNVADSTRCLILDATRGLEPNWNHVEQSVGHRVIPLPDTEAIRRLPMVARLLTDLGIEIDRFVLGESDAASETPGGVFFVENAPGSPAIPAQREFVLHYGIRSVLGFGGVLPDGEVFAVIMFARAPIPRDRVPLFKLLALQASLAFTYATDLVADPATLLSARAQAYSELLRVQEYQYLRHAGLLLRDHESLLEQKKLIEATRVRELEESHRRQQRAQKALMNVVEDLREARAQLERRVEQRTAELASANAELQAKNAELEQFAYIASHDLQEPLRTISGYVQLLQERYGDRLDAEAHEFISYAVRGTIRQQELIEALLEYSRVKQVKLAPVALDEAVDDALRAISRAVTETRASIDRRPLPTVEGDLVQLRQLFQNLLTNALKFSGAEPPRIEIWADADSSDTIDVHVRDHGIGFDPKYAEQVFKVFRRLQRKYPGTGIGLAICRKIAERHGGAIRAVSSPGKGATFTVSLHGVST